MDHLHRLAPVLVLTLCRDDQREVRKDRQLSSACSALAGGNILLFWTHLDRLPSADSRYQLQTDRKSTRLNSSHTVISYAVFCLKKKKKERMAMQVV